MNEKVIGISSKNRFMVKFDDGDERTLHLNALKSLMATSYPTFRDMGELHTRTSASDLEEGNHTQEPYDESEDEALEKIPREKYVCRDK